MNFREIIKYKVPLPIVLAVITLAVYLPFWIHLLQLRDVQIRNNEDIRTVLPVFGSDSIGYGLLVDGILEHHDFSGDTFRTPGYPGMLAVFKYLFGSYKFFPLVQVLFTILTAVLILRIGTKIFSKGIGMIAAILYVIDPNTIWHTLTILSDVPFALFLILSIYYMYFSDIKNQYLANGLAGFFLGAATLIRPISMYMPLFLLPIYVYINMKRRPNPELIKSTALILVMFILLMTPWLVRNREVAGVWGIASVQDFNFFHYNIPEYVSFKRGVTPDDVRREVYAELESRGVKQAGSDSLSNSAVMHDISYRYLKEDLFGYAKWHTFKLTTFFFASGIKNFFYIYNAILHYNVYGISNANMTNFLLRGNISEFLNVLRGQILITMEQVFWVLVFLLMFLPLLYRDKRSYVLLLLTLILYLALPTVPVAYSRFRIPAAPYMFTLASAGFIMVKEFIMLKLRRVK